MIRGLVFLALVVIIGFVGYTTVTELAGGIKFDAFKSWSLFRVSPGPQFSSPETRKKIVSAPASQPKTEKPKVEEKKPQVTPPTGFTLAQLSPYYEKIKITSIKPPKSVWDTSQFTLKAYHDDAKGISVTGWRLRANSGKEVPIGKAVSDYNFSPSLEEGDTILFPGDYLNVYSWSNEIAGGRNLRLNKCTGYLNAIYPFSPALPNNCPAFNRADIVTFRGPCQSLILSLTNCKVPTPTQINDISGLNDSACRSFLDKINFNGCYSAHRKDPDFFSHEWRMWIGRYFPFDREHDRVLLFDADGLLVHERTY